ncbi:MAG TPA: hypothetical protein VK447_04685 [Myxococcaceae bacterium]|nr:hypothetical protein [Myxococcaceae bacterium]
MPPRGQDGFTGVARPANLVPAAAPAHLRGPGIGNDYKMEVSGRHPPVSAGGFFTELRQGVATARLSRDAAESVMSGGRSPPDFVVAARLRSLQTTPAIDNPRELSVNRYTSRLEGVSPDRAYDFFVNDPNAVFGAGDIKIRPEVSSLKDGMRLMLENGGPPPMWMPIAVRLDPANRSIHITTLDGHPLRGTNDFTFKSDGKGGTVIDQLSRFNGSSPLSSVGINLMGALQKQHVTWEKVHALFFNELRGGR